MTSKLVNSHSETTTLVYDDANRKTLSQEGNGTKAGMAYIAANRMNGVVNLNSTNSTLSYFNCTFDRISDRTSIWDAAAGRNTCCAERKQEMQTFQRRIVPPHLAVSTINAALPYLRTNYAVNIGAGDG